MTTPAPLTPAIADALEMAVLDKDLMTTLDGLMLPDRPGTVRDLLASLHLELCL